MDAVGGRKAWRGFGELQRGVSLFTLMFQPYHLEGYRTPWPALSSHVSSMVSTSIIASCLLLPTAISTCLGLLRKEGEAGRGQEKRGYFHKGKRRTRKCQAKEEGLRERGFLFLSLGSNITAPKDCHSSSGAYFPFFWRQQWLCGQMTGMACVTWCFLVQNHE